MAFLIGMESRQDETEAGMGSDRDENAADNEVEGEDVEPGGEVAREHSRLYMKVKHFNMFIDDTAKGLSDGEFRVWLVLFRFANNGIARASKKTLGERAGRSERQVARDIEGLIEKGLVKPLDKHDGYKRRGNEYRLGIKSLPKLSKHRRVKQPSSPEIAATPNSNPTEAAVETDPALEFFARKPR